MGIPSSDNSETKLWRSSRGVQLLRDQARPVHDLAEVPPHVGVILLSAYPRREHQAKVVPLPPCCPPMCFLSLSVDLKGRHGALRQRQGASRLAGLSLTSCAHRPPDFDVRWLLFGFPVRSTCAQVSARSSSVRAPVSSAVTM
jgi:hypothetical protein